MFKKPIIVFEGIEGSGKTHHIKKVANYLKKKNIKFLKLREPGGSHNSEKIRNLLMSNNSKFNRFTDFLLYMAARNENYISLLKKNYNKKVILIDRFIDSTIAYQHYGMGIDIKLIKKLNKVILGNFSATFTFLHTVNMKNLKLRLNKRKKLNRYDKFNDNFYKKAQNGFIKIAKKKKNYYIVDSNQEKKLNEKIILKKISKYFL